MGKESRDREAGRLTVLKSIQGHDNSVVHSFNHTEGRCPMCGCPQQVMMFCAPDEDEMPKVRGCELDGRHLHRVCQSCRYPFIERCMDQSMLSDERGEVAAESELAAAMAVILEHANGVELETELLASRRGWVIRFERDFERRLIRFTASPPAESRGRAVHPDISSMDGSPE